MAYFRSHTKSPHFNVSSPNSSTWPLIYIQLYYSSTAVMPLALRCHPSLDHAASKYPDLHWQGQYLDAEMAEAQAFILEKYW
jgi:hypothetical protein